MGKATQTAWNEHKDRITPNRLAKIVHDGKPNTQKPIGGTHRYPHMTKAKLAKTKTS